MNLSKTLIDAVQNENRPAGDRSKAILARREVIAEGEV